MSLNRSRSTKLSDDKEKIHIIGAGPAGVSAVETLRANNFAGEIHLYSAEDSPPYSPAALGEYLLQDEEDILFWKGRNFAEKYHVVEHRNEPVIELDPENNILTSRHSNYHFDKLLIASGSSLHISSVITGHDKPGLLNFKNLSSAEKIKALAQEKGQEAQAIIVGGGFIGVEIALCLAQLGIKPSVLNRRGWIMPRLLDKETASYVVKDLESQGVNVLLNTEGNEFLGEEEITGLKTTSGQILQGDIYIAATGVKPNIEFLDGTSIKTDWGIPVNSRLETNFDHIYAAGDVALTRDFFSGELKSHGLHPVAVNHGRTAALNMLGQEQQYQPMLSMNSLKELNFKLMVVGELNGEVLKKEGEGYLRKIYLQEDRIVGFVLLGDISASGIFLSLLKKKTNVKDLKDKLLNSDFNNSYLTSFI